MKEIELKILEVDAGTVLRRLGELGARKVFDGPVTASYFDFADGRIAREDSIVRLRKKGDQAEFAFKRTLAKTESRIMDEFEVCVDDFESARQILLALGLREFYRLAKHRASYLLDGTHFELDTYEGLPTFLEIESPTVESLKQWVIKLGFALEVAKPWSVKDVLRHYGKLSLLP